MKRLSGDRQGIIGAIIAVIVVVIVIIILLALIFIPFRDVSVNESRHATVQSGIDSLNLVLTMDAGAVNVVFVNDTTGTVDLSLTGHQHSGLLGSSTPLNITWQTTTSGSTLNVNGAVKVGQGFFNAINNNLNCTLQIPAQLRTSMAISNSLGAVDVTTVAGVNLSSVNLKASTGAVSLVMASKSVLSGPMNLDASTGGVNLKWTDVQARENASVTMKTNTGGVTATFTQSDPLGANVTVSSGTSLGGSNIVMNLGGNNSAHVLSHANLGGISVQGKTGFTGSDNNLSSQNYPQDSNFELSADANTGGINLKLSYVA